MDGDGPGKQPTAPDHTRPIAEAVTYGQAWSIQRARQRGHTGASTSTAPEPSDERVSSNHNGQTRPMERNHGYSLAVTLVPRLPQAVVMLGIN